MAERLDNVHPGDILRDDFLKPWGKNANWLAVGTGMTRIHVSQLLKGQRAVTAPTALRLAKFLGTTPRFWLNLQAGYDLEEAQRDEKLTTELAQIVPVDGESLPVYLDDEREGAPAPRDSRAISTKSTLSP